MISADALLTTQYAITASAIGTACCGQMKVPIVPPTAVCTRLAACAAARTVATLSAWRDQCTRCGSMSHCMIAPAAATISIACGPSSSSAVKSITKDGGTVAQSFAVNCCTARVEVSNAARISPENSSIRGCGQPASPSNAGIPTAMTPNVTRSKLSEGI